MTPPVGFRFQLFITPKTLWKPFRERVRQRLSAVGRDPELAEKYAPASMRALFGGTVDRRLKSGSLSYGVAGLQRDGQARSVAHGLFDRAMSFEFGQTWEQPDDDVGEAFGLYFNAWHFGFAHCERFEAKTIPEEKLAVVDVWAAFVYLVDIEAAGTRPPTTDGSDYGSSFKSPPFAPDMKFRVIYSNAGPPAWLLENDFVDYMFVVELMRE